MRASAHAVLLTYCIIFSSLYCVHLQYTAWGCMLIRLLYDVCVHFADSCTSSVSISKAPFGRTAHPAARCSCPPLRPRLTSMRTNLGRWRSWCVCVCGQLNTERTKSHLRRIRSHPLPRLKFHHLTIQHATGVVRVSSWLLT